MANFFFAVAIIAILVSVFSAGMATYHSLKRGRGLKFWDAG